MQFIFFFGSLEWESTSIIVPNHHCDNAFWNCHKKHPYIDKFVHSVGSRLVSIEFYQW
jgi:hypothetical protein